MTRMRYWIQRHDYTSQDFPAVDLDGAVAAFRDYGWAAELAAGGPEDGRNCPSGMGIHNGFGDLDNDDPRLLHICPFNETSVFFHLHYDRRETKRLFGLLTGRNQRDHYVETYPLEDVPHLIRLFYQGRLDDILAIPGETTDLQL